MRKTSCTVSSTSQFMVIIASLLLSSSARHFVIGQTTTTTEDQVTLLEGGIVTRTNVKEYADLSLDIRDMRTYKDDPTRLRSLYREGFHAENMSTGKLLPLKYLSDIFTEPGTILTPNYLLHIYGLTYTYGDSNIQARLADMGHYASERIELIIQGSRPDLAPDAVLALSMWMYATHMLYRGVLLCQERTEADDPNFIKEFGGGGMDEFIALWIGRDQTAGNSDGHGLYAWAQEIGDYFKTNNPEARVNSNIKLLYQEGATILSVHDACTKENTVTVKQLWNIATQITKEMMKPLFQWFIYHLLLQNRVEVELYATALFPQIARCRPSLYKRLADKVERGIQFENKYAILDDIREAYKCFGIKCIDIANFGDDNEAMTCTDEDRYPRLAGYRPSSDVEDLSRIDLDIRQLRIFSLMDSSPFTMFTYKYGSNVPKPRASENDPFELISIESLAVSASRSQSTNPVYGYFLSYHNNHNYADKDIRAILDGSSKWTDREQKAEALALISSFEIVFMDCIQKLFDSVTMCKEVDPEIGFQLDSNADRHPLDSAAALMIGSLEGSDLGGAFDREDGELLWGLANQRAFQFQTMNDMNYALVNAKILDLLYAARGELDAADCKKLETSVDRIFRYLQVGIIQAMLSAAIESQDRENTSDHLSLVQGEILALSILPIIDADDISTAQLIRENMVIKDGVDTVRDGAKAVADGLGYYATNVADIPCEYIGATGDINPCAKYGGVSFSSSQKTSATLATAFAVLLIVAL